MQKCLVTKLQGIVKDDTLPIMGAFRLKLKEGTATKALNSSDGTSELFVKSGSVTMSDGGQVLPVPGPIHWTGWKTITIGSGGAEVIVTNKYKILNFDALLDLAEPTPVDDFNYMVELQTLNEYQGAGAKYGIIGDLKDLKGLDKMTMINWQGVGCTGDIVELAKFPILEAAYLFSEQVYGELTDLARAYRSKGRTTGSINLGWMAHTITWNGESAAVRDNTTLSWTPTTISWNGKTVNL